MAASQFIPSPLPQCSHYEQPGIIVPPPSTANLTVTGSTPVLSNSPCPDCALHSTILHSMAFNMQSMDYTACHHLHASASCSSCYSNYQLQQHRDGSGQSRNNHHVFPGSKGCHCGRQPAYNPDQYPMRSNPNLFINGNSSYPSYQYQDWHQSSNESVTFHPPPLDLAHTNTDAGTYPSITSTTILSLPSPTISIPSISPYLPNLENHSKVFEIPPICDSSHRNTNPYNTHCGSILPIEITQNHAQEAGTDTAGLDGNINDKIDPLVGISGIKISEVKVEQRNEKCDLERKLQRNSSDKKKKSQERQGSAEVRKRHPEDLCQVCGDRASGYHYNALTCEGCKGFFRRSITNKTTYKQGCKQGGTCEMDTYTRRKCPHCRLKKCREVGMLEECLLTEIQCQSKRRRRKAKQEQAEETKHDETSQNENMTSPSRSSVASSPCGSDSSRNEDGSVSLILTDDERSLIEQVSEAFKQYNINPDIVRRWEKYINKESNKTCRFSDITTVHVQVLVEYTKSLPGFITLDPEDQIALLKGSVFEAMLIRNSCGYHHLTRKINMQAIIEETGTEASKMEALLDFFSCIGKLAMDEIEYALLIAVVVFNSDYAYVKNKAAVEEYQDNYLSALAKYSIAREPHRPSIFAKILAALTEIRSLSHYNAEIVTSWKKRGALTPLLCEIWDLD